MSDHYVSTETSGLDVVAGSIQAHILGCKDLKNIYF